MDAISISDGFSFTDFRGIFRFHRGITLKEKIFSFLFFSFFKEKKMGAEKNHHLWMAGWALGLK